MKNMNLNCQKFKGAGKNTSPFSNQILNLSYEYG